MSFGNSFSDFIRKFQVIQYQYSLKPSKSAIFAKFWSCFRFPRCSMRDAFMHLSWICKNYATSAHLAFNIRYYNEFIIIFLASNPFLQKQNLKGLRLSPKTIRPGPRKPPLNSLRLFFGHIRTTWAPNKPGNKIIQNLELTWRWSPCSNQIITGYKCWEKNGLSDLCPKECILVGIVFIYLYYMTGYRSKRDFLC